jgi:hypothetical protein
MHSEGDRRSARTAAAACGSARCVSLVPRSLRAVTLGVSYLDDSSVHEQMVRFATQQFRRGHLPLTSWFPFLGSGSPQFLHYQSLPAMLTGPIGLAVGPDAAFRWTLYLLLSLWPVSVYLAARLFGAGRPAAGTSAAMCPFLVSATGIGYEQHAYVWVGFGVWTQLWASLTLPLAWGYSWRAIRDGRNYIAAVGLTSLTVALDFETGYLALIALLVWPLVAGAPIVRSVRRAAVLVGGSLLAAAWVIVPLIEQRDWAATNELLHGTALVNGYGAGRVLGWLGTGQLLDHGRLPVVTLFAAIGLALACTHSTTDANAGGRARSVPAVVVRQDHVRSVGRRGPHDAYWSVGEQGFTNVSHGCVNMPPADAEIYYKMALPGDPVTITGSPRPGVFDDGWTMWFLPWKRWLHGSSLHEAVRITRRGSTFFDPHVKA